MFHAILKKSSYCVTYKCNNKVQNNMSAFNDVRHLLLLHASI